jgi:hypothetical protein
VRSCGGDGRKQDEKGDPGSKEGNKGVWEVRMLTRNTQACLVSPEEGHPRQNRRKTSLESEKGTANWARFRVPWADSLQRRTETKTAHLLVVVARFGAVGDGGSTVSGGGAVGWFLTEKKKGEKMVAVTDGKERPRVSRRIKREEGGSR